MNVRPEALQNVAISDGNGGTWRVPQGHFLPLREVDAELIGLEREGFLKLHTPQNIGDAGISAGLKLVRVVYTGSRTECITPFGLFYRMVPSVVSEDRLADVKRFFDGASTVLDFCDTRGVYVAHASRVPVSDWDSQIGDRLPAAPNVLIMRDEGAGDVIASIPTVRRIREKLPYAWIVYATKPAFAGLLAGISEIDKIVSIHAIDLTTGSDWDLVINWCRALESYKYPRNRGLRIDSFAKHVGLGVLEDRELELHVSPAARQKARKLIGDKCPKDKIRIGYVMQAAAWNRTWSLWRVPELFRAFARAMPNAKLVLIDRDVALGGDFYGDHPNILNLCGQTDSFLEAAAVCETCDLVIAPDTGLVHACEALGVPALALIGSIPPAARYATYRYVNWIHPAGRPGAECCPCWDWQERWSRDEKLAQPERGIYRSCLYDRDVKCMAAIGVEEIVREAQGMLGDIARYKQVAELELV